jgi:hypothetical protein
MQTGWLDVSAGIPGDIILTVIPQGSVALFVEHHEVTEEYFTSNHPDARSQSAEFDVVKAYKFSMEVQGARVSGKFRHPLYVRDFEDLEVTDMDLKEDIAPRIAEVCGPINFEHTICEQ